ncbi:MAG: hypothetical protein JRF31_09725 [Deltaproteobacteria bacterium]|nr:hypothetical protein [Deltaproteobacteria bacterium]
MNKSYKIISYSFLILVVAYVGLGQLIIAANVDIDSKWSILFTGHPRLQIRHNVLKLEFKVDSSTIEFQFTKPLTEKVKPLSPKDHNLIYAINMSTERDWLTIKALKGKSLQNIPLAFSLSDPEKPGYFVKRYISTVKVNGAPYSVSKIYKNLLRLGSSNVYLYYPFQLSNLSGFLANTFGSKFVYLIISLLLVLLICQAFLFAVSIVWQPDQVKDYFDNPEPGTAVTVIDSIANRFAIPLGFLGTVASVWYSLEGAETDYRSFVQILEIVKIAIFTTVLGLSIKILCILRGYHSGIFSGLRSNRRNDAP